MGLPFQIPALFPLGADDAAGVGVEGYKRQLMLLLPPGRAFNLEANSTINQTLEALATELARIDARGGDAILESDPRTAVELIGEWEKALGLPDDRVTEIAPTLAARQVAVTQKFVARGGQNYAYFAQLVSACGYTLNSITLFVGSMFRCGSRIGSRLYGVPYAYAMQLNVNAPAGIAVDHPTLERIVRHETHAHIVDIFNYL